MVITYLTEIPLIISPKAGTMPEWEDLQGRDLPGGLLGNADAMPSAGNCRNQEAGLWVFSGRPYASYQVGEPGAPQQRMKNVQLKPKQSKPKVLSSRTRTSEAMEQLAWASYLSRGESCRICGTKRKESDIGGLLKVVNKPCFCVKLQRAKEEESMF